MADDIGARVRAAGNLADVIAELLGEGLGFSCLEDNDKAMEWALRAYRAGQAAAPDGPRTWALPDEPGPEVTAVRACMGTVFARDGDGWRAVGYRGEAWSWRHLVRDAAPLTDATAWAAEQAALLCRETCISGRPCVLPKGHDGPMFHDDGVPR